MATDRQIQANRRNARRSTGPNTAQGKARSSQNALKHGLLSREVVIPRGDGADDGDDVATMRERLMAEWHPEGPTEELWVEQIVAAWVRLARVLRAQRGMTELRVDAARFQTAEGARAQIQRQALRMDPLRNAGSNPVVSQEIAQKAIAELKRSSLGIGILLDELDAIIAAVDAEGELDEFVKSRLAGLFRDDQTELGAWLRQAAAAAQANDDASLDPHPTSGATICALLRRHRAELEARRDQLTSVEEMKLEAEVARLALVPSDEMDKLLRYETTFMNRIEKAQNQLLILQKARRQRNGSTAL